MIKQKHNFISDYVEFFSDIDTVHLQCPSCGNDFTHFSAIQFQNGKDGYEADWQGRGDLLKIRIWGECDGIWFLCIGFHKGHLHMFSEIEAPCSSEYGALMRDNSTEPIEDHPSTKFSHVL